MPAIAGTRMLLFLLLLLSPLSAVAQSRYMKSYTVNEGLAGNHVYLCHQDREGYLWVATSSGLSRFDGKRFRNYDFENGLPNNEVLFVTSDPHNRLWLNVFSPTPSFALIDRGLVRNYRNSELLAAMPANIVVNTSVCSQTYRTLYFSGNMLYVCCKEGRKPLQKGKRLIAGNALFQVSDTGIFLGDERHIYALKDTALRLVQELDAPSCSYHWYGGTLYVVRSRAVDLYHYTAGRFIRFKRASFPRHILRLHPDRYGLWINFDNEAGAWLYRDRSFAGQPEKIDIPGIVNYIMDDAEGNVWVCTVDKGLFFLPDPELVNYSARDGLQSSMVSAVCPLSASSCWVGYATGGADLLSFGEGGFRVRQRILPGKLFPGNNIVLDIVRDREGTTYFFTREGLFLVQGNRLTKALRHIAGKSFFLINDSLWGLSEQRYRVYNRKTGTTVLRQLGRIYAQVTDAAQNLWLGGMNGLYCIPAGQQYSSDSIEVKAMRKIRINALAMHEPYLWAGTQNNGLFLLRRDSVIAWYTHPQMPALCANNILALALKDDCLWIGTNKGITCNRFNYTTLRFESSVKADYQDGLLSPEINKIKLLDSTVFIASSGGLVVTKRLRSARLSYTLSDVSVHDLETGATFRDTEAYLTYAAKGLEVAFNTTGFRYGPEISYHYMLAPFDKSWHTTANNLVQYTNIPPGDYRFLVRATDNRGNSSGTVRTIPIHIHPLYWQTWWFALLLAAAVIALLGMALYAWMRHNRRRAQQRMNIEKLIARSQLVALRAQLKPHFLYNSLNAINDFIYNNKNDDAASLLRGFAGFIRKGFHLADQDYTTIEEEVGFITRYFELERKKCDDCFGYTIMAAEALREQAIPSLITQPFIENAVLHGIRALAPGKGNITITYTLQGNDIVCTISDNGPGIRRSLEAKKLYRSYSKGLSIGQERMTYFRTALGTTIHLSVLDLSEATPAAAGTKVTITFANGFLHVQH